MKCRPLEALWFFKKLDFGVLLVFWVKFLLCPQVKFWLGHDWKFDTKMDEDGDPMDENNDSRCVSKHMWELQAFDSNFTIPKPTQMHVLFQRIIYVVLKNQLANPP
jgi:hypothetical protein